MEREKLSFTAELMTAIFLWSFTWHQPHMVKNCESMLVFFRLSMFHLTCTKQKFQHHFLIQCRWFITEYHFHPIIHSPWLLLLAHHPLVFLLFRCQWWFMFGFSFSWFLTLHSQTLTPVSAHLSLYFSLLYILLWLFSPDSLTPTFVNLYVSLLQPLHFLCTCFKL